MKLVICTKFQVKSDWIVSESRRRGGGGPDWSLLKASCKLFFSRRLLVLISNPCCIIIRGSFLVGQGPFFNRTPEKLKTWTSIHIYRPFENIESFFLHSFLLTLFRRFTVPHNFSCRVFKKAVFISTPKHPSK